MQRIKLHHRQPGNDDVQTQCEDVDVTKCRPPARHLEEKGIPEPGVGRATEAITIDHPHGSDISGKKNANRSVMQKHVDFFDRNGDGIITMPDTFIGFRRIGFNWFFCVLAMLFIHGGFSFFTCPHYIPDPFMRIYTKNIHRAKHGSDQEVYDQEGRFIPQKYEDLFAKWDCGNKGGLSAGDLWRMTQATWDVMDIFGWLAGKFEWFTLWLLAADDRGLVTKEAVRSCYDGTLFEMMERKYREKKQVPNDYAKLGDHGFSLMSLFRRRRTQDVAKPKAQ